MQCPNCGSAKYSKRIADHRYVESGLEHVTLSGVAVYRCAVCNEHEVLIPAIESLHRTIAQHLARKARPLTAAEFRFLRKYLGFSSSDFAKKIRVRPETLSRWETAERPVDSVADVLIRVLVATSVPVEHYPAEVLEVSGTKRQPSAARMKVIAPKSSRNEWRVPRAA